AAAPLDGDHPYRFSQIWHYERPEALALVKASLNESLPVYALFTSPAEMTSQQSRLPVVPGYEWRTVNDSHSKAVILKLALAQSPEGASPQSGADSQLLLEAAPGSNLSREQESGQY